jgi:hypothetical protein
LTHSMLVHALAAVAVIPIETNDAPKIDHQMYITSIYIKCHT